MTTAILNLNEINASQSNKENTHSSILRQLEAPLGRAITNLANTDPIAVNGDIYAVIPPATGLFTGKEDNFAYYFDGEWTFTPIVTNQIVFLRETKQQIVFDGSDWIALNDLENTPVTTLNITGEINKRYFLNGSTSFNLPVGVNEGDRLVIVDYGGTFNSANLTVNRSGSNTIEDNILTSIVLDVDDSVTEFIFSNNIWRIVKGASKVISGEAYNDILNSDVTYYVNSSTGLDTNDGLTPGTAFLTIQKALDTLKPRFLKVFNVDIVLDGTFDITDANIIRLEYYQSITGKATLRGSSAGAATLSAQAGFTQDSSVLGSEGIIQVENDSKQWTIADLDFSVASAGTTIAPCIKVENNSLLNVEGTINFNDGTTSGIDGFVILNDSQVIVREITGTTIVRFNATSNFVRRAFSLEQRSSLNIGINTQLEFNASNQIIAGGAFVYGRELSGVQILSTYVGTLQGAGLRYNLDLISNIRRSSDFPGTLTTDSLLNFSELT